MTYEGRICLLGPELNSVFSVSVRTKTQNLYKLYLNKTFFNINIKGQIGSFRLRETGEPAIISNGPFSYKLPNNSSIKEINISKNNVYANNTETAANLIADIALNTSKSRSNSDESYKACKFNEKKLLLLKRFKYR